MESKGLTISEASSDADLFLVEKLAKVIWTEHYTPIIGSDQVAYMLEKFQSAMAMRKQIEEGMSYYLIFGESEAIGYLAIKIDGDELFLSKIYVLVEKRGRGYGKTAMNFVESRARKMNFTALSLTVNKNNSNAIKAYEKLGFINMGPCETDIGGGFVMDDYLMRKIISL